VQRESELLERLKSLVDPTKVSVDVDNAQLHALLDELVVVQQSLYTLPQLTNVPPTRADALHALESWLVTHAPECLIGDTCALAMNGDSDANLVALRDLQPSELFVRAPRHIMLSSESAMQSSLADFFKRDPLCYQNPSTMLSLHLAAERRRNDSFWRPYLDALPTLEWCFQQLPPFFSRARLELFRGTSIVAAAHNLLRGFVRQYVYLRLVLPSSHFAVPLCWTEWVWAVGTMISRQNKIPNRELTHAAIALIPPWDFANHSAEAEVPDTPLAEDSEQSPNVGTTFNQEQHCLESYCPPPGVKAGSPIPIFYGPRSNSQLFLYQGFALPHGTRFDRAPCRMSLPLDDPLLKMKHSLLKQLKLTDGNTYDIVPISAASVPFDADGEPDYQCAAVQFARVAVLTKDEIAILLRNPEVFHSHLFLFFELLIYSHLILSHSDLHHQSSQ
jgi:hypothetical protein